MSDLDEITKAIKEVSDRTIRIEVLSETHSKYIDEIRDHLNLIHTQDQVQNQLLAEHIAGVKTTRELIQIEAKKLENEIQARKEFQAIHQNESNAKHQASDLKISDLAVKVAESEKIRHWFTMTAKIFGGIATIGGGIAVIYALFTHFLNQ